jgi:hypothetical protein
VDECKPLVFGGDVNMLNQAVDGHVTGGFDAG